MIDFVKTHALGNDFILVQKGAVPVKRYTAFAQAICHRNFGVGADGVIFWVQKGDVFDLRIFNRDGGEAECSGNGLRCAAAYLMESGRWPRPQIQLRTISGTYALRRNGAEYEADMGVPALRPEEIPFIPERPMDKVIDYPFLVDGEEVRISLCATGNPHCSLFVSELDDSTISRLGPRLESDPAFPNRTNVAFIRIDSGDEVTARIFERGVGETLSSGTGACASALTALLRGAHSPVTVRLEGGELTVDVDKQLNITLTGWAEPVFEGELSSELVRALEQL